MLNTTCTYSVSKLRGPNFKNETSVLTRGMQVLVILAALGVSNTQAENLADARSIKIIIEKISNTKSPYSEDLYPHLRKLARVQLDNRQFADAIDNFRRMQNLVHRHQGVHSPLQFESIDLLAQLHTVMGNFKQVDQLQEFRFLVAQHSYPSSSSDMLEPQLRMAAWYRDTRRYKRSLLLLQESRELIRRNDLSRFKLIEALRSEALTLYLAGICCAGEPLQEADMLMIKDDDARSFTTMARNDMLYLLNDEEAIRRSNEAIRNDEAIKANWEPKFLGFTRQSDIVKSFNKTLVLRSKANSKIEVLSIYSADYSADSDKLQSRNKSVIVGDPVPVCRQGATNLIGVSAKRLGDFSVDVDLKVDRSGDVLDIQIEGNVPNRLKMYLRNILEEARYRPGIERNQIASETQISFKQTFNPTTVNARSQWGLILNFHACSLLPILDA